MSVLDIRLYGDPVLRRKADPIDEFDGDLKELAEDMVDTMYEADGVGLAALPGVGARVGPEVQRAPGRGLVLVAAEHPAGLAVGREAGGLRMGGTTMNKGLLIGAGVVGLGALAIAASPKAQQAIQEGVEDAIDTSRDWMSRVIARVSAHEGSYDSLNLNSDGAGLSFGILQWAQKPGTLGGLLTAMYQADPDRFVATFGPAWSELLQATTAGSLAPVGGVVLWKEPWIGRFRAAGRDPVFVEVQNRMAAEGDHFKGALEAAWPRPPEGG